MTGEWRPCFVVPVYNHHETVSGVLERLRGSGLPVILVNDGSGPECRSVLRQLARDYDFIELLELPVNEGKGGAVKKGLKLARERGFSHALQVDADGQHALEDVEHFLTTGRRQPAALISGLPLYDRDIPKSRYYGRFITQFWVVINTLSLKIKDSMCGFRLYPVPQAVRLVDEERVGNRMDFDTEIMVRWVWRGGDVVHIPTRVNYPEDGVSHFRMWRDNLLISKMHSRLFFGMLWRLPRLLGRSFRRGTREQCCE